MTVNESDDAKKANEIFTFCVEKFCRFIFIVYLCPVFAPEAYAIDKAEAEGWGLHR